MVTPFVGVWIETISARPEATEIYVTPFVGVWIETKGGEVRELSQASHPSWVCGLKQLKINDWQTEQQVTPFVGVWIETYQFRAVHWYAVSHPSWVCGLKQLMTAKDYLTARHTLRGCVD